ncbi:MAG: hypothetical protein MUF49_24770 [Oculatellaceae cyanobacterium Prado106]|jgi:hypothetical protein|nr:hypothetical protein [Oculatellaceae cyanobacterium Prado106]
MSDLSPNPPDPRLSLHPRHFADLVRLSQVIYNPAGGLRGAVKVDWQEFGISLAIEEDLRSLGQKYWYSVAQIPPDEVWRNLSVESRTWFIDNKNRLWQIEEAFPPGDED